jgi:SAM-dependent methyltransferase
MERMPPVTGSSAEPAGQAAANDYDSFAEAYSAVNEVSLHNAYYERPATLALAGDVAGRRVLDAGCGSGPLFAALRDRGAVVTGFDKSAGMLELARRRLFRDLPVFRRNHRPSGQSFVLTFWHRPLPVMISAFTAAGFRIAAIDEPLTAPGTPRELLPDFLKDKPPGSGLRTSPPDPGSCASCSSSWRPT